MKTEKLAHWAEIISSFVVILTLIFLIHEVQRNTRALERQSRMDRAAVFSDPFFEAPELASVLSKIKAVDGFDALPEALMERYDLTHTEAILWDRHLSGIWWGLWTDYVALGPDEVESWVRSLLGTGDNTLYWENNWLTYAGSDFGTFVDSIAAEVKTDS